MSEKNIKEIHSFVRRCGHMSDNKKELLATNFGGYLIPFPQNGEKLSFKDIFGNENPVTVEIGFGMGDSLIYFTEKYPERNILGLEVHEPGVARVVSLLTQAGENRSNLKMVIGDAVQLLENSIEDGSVDSFHIFFPDPWPKKKHHKRRLLQRPFVELLLKKLKVGGYIATATDWEEYGLEMHELFESISTLKPQFEGGFCDRQPFRPLTKFEQKGIDKNHRIINLVYIKQADN